MSAVKSLNRPRTLETIMWRTVKPTLLWAVSTVQVPAGRVVVVDSLMGVPSGVGIEGDPTELRTRYRQILTIATIV